MPLVVTALLVGPTMAHADTIEAGLLMYDPDEASSTCDDQLALWESVTEWGDVMEDHGCVYDDDRKVYAEELADGDLVSWGNDSGSLNVDENDITLLATHGGLIPQYDDSLDSNPSSYEVNHAVFYLGSASGNGHTDYNGCVTYGEDMRIGDNDVEFVHAVSCQSFQWQSLTGGKLPHMDHHLHQYGGFHGAVGYEAFDEAGDFGEDAFDDSVAWAWMDNMKVYSNACPMNVVLGNDGRDCLNRRDNETYNMNYSDPSSSAIRLVMYSTMCNPIHGSRIEYGSDVWWPLEVD